MFTGIEGISELSSQELLSIDGGNLAEDIGYVAGRACRAIADAAKSVGNAIAAAANAVAQSIAEGNANCPNTFSK